jgi:predicted DNA binding CopG/RHH family protein
MKRNERMDHSRQEMTRMQIMLDPELLRRAKWRASEVGISLAEYIRRLVARDLEGGLRAHIRSWPLPRLQYRRA